MDSLKSPLWDFALDIYGRPGVRDACLTLQEEAQVDVISLIVVVYATTHLSAPLAATEIQELRLITEGWRAAVVVPLRAIRKALKLPMLGISDEKQGLREQIKAVELRAEQIQLAIAERWLRNRSPLAGLALRDALYELWGACKVSGPTRNEGLEAALTVILQSAHVIADRTTSAASGNTSAPRPMPPEQGKSSAMRCLD